MDTQETSITTQTIHSKKCSKCGEVKPLDLFVHDKNKPDGFTLQCKKCRKESRSRTVLKRIKAGFTKQDKKCGRCGVVKPSDMFFKNKNKTDLLSSECKECCKIIKDQLVSERIEIGYKRDLKKCWKCGETKPSNMFNYNKSKFDLLSSECISCSSEYGKQARLNRKEIAFVAENRTCPKCNLLKPNSEFHSARSNVDGLATYCKSCKSDLTKKRPQKHTCIICNSHFYSVLNNRLFCSKKCATNYWWQNLPNHKFLQTIKKYRLRQKEDVLLLRDTYIKQRISANTHLKAADIPQSLVEAYRTKIQIERLIKSIETL